MGNQRRFAAQASDPPQTARIRGRKSNGPTPSPFPPTRAGAKFSPHFSFPILLSAALPVGPLSRSRRPSSVIPVSDDPHAVFGAARPIFPALGGGRGSRAYGILGHDGQDDPLSANCVEQSSRAEPRMATPASAVCPFPSFHSTWSRHPAGTALRISQISFRIAAAFYVRPCGRIRNRSDRQNVHTEEEEKNVAPRTGQWSPVRQRTVSRQGVGCQAGNILADHVFRFFRAPSRSIRSGKRPGDRCCAREEQAARDS